MKMRRSLQWRSLYLNDWTYQPTSRGCFIKEKLSQVSCPLSHFPLALCIIAIGLANNSFCKSGDLYRYIDCILYCFFSDEHRLSDYSIGPEAKLNLVIRPVGERSGASGMVASSSGGNCGNSQERVWQTVSTILSRHFSPADAAKVHEQLIKVCFFFPSSSNNALHFWPVQYCVICVAQLFPDILSLGFLKR